MEINLLFVSFLETLFMVGFSTLVGTVLGGALGVGLFLYSPKGFTPHGRLYAGLSFLVNTLRSIPFVILMILLIPITRFVLGSSIGTLAATLPLSLAATLLIARGVEEAFGGVPKEIKEVGIVSGASLKRIFYTIFFPEARPLLIGIITSTAIGMVGFSTMAGTIGGGGLGDLAIRYGYHRYNFLLILEILVVLIFLVHIIQKIGEWARGARVK